jgi:hypothetical protein
LIGWVGRAAAQGTTPEPDADAEVGAATNASDSTAAQAPSAPAAPPAQAPSAAPPVAAPSAPPSAVAAAPTGSAPVAPPPVVPPPKAEASEPFIDITGYAQVEYQSHAESDEQLQQGSNTTLNQNRFLVRRARLALKRAWQYTSLELELDGNTVNGPAFGLYRAEAAAYYRPDKSKAPLVQLTLGMLKVPFGFETPQSSGERYFMERTQTSRALFPSEIDVGARLHGQLGPFKYAAALTNGEPLGEKSGFQLVDPNKNKDFWLYAGAKGSPADILTIAGGVSANKGRGFHAGTPATKNSVNWNNLNEDGTIDTGELNGVPARAAIPSQTFERWAVGGDLEVEVKTPLGNTLVYAEVVVAENLDRGYFPADPVSAGQDTREFGYYFALTQDITPYGLVGFRFDRYDPNADSTDTRAGKTLPADNTVTTYSPLVGVQLPKRARLCFQYDIIKDHLARDVSGVPTDLENNAWTLRLQVNL